MKTQITLIAALATLTIPGLASAAPVETNSVKVSVADLNLASSQGRALAEQRINRAAKSVCGGGIERGLQASIAFHNCKDQAVSNATVALRKLTATVEVAAR